MGLDERPLEGWWADLRIKLLVIEWEVVLGCWLLSGHRSIAAWAAALATFTGFAGLSGYLGVVGAPSCGCFGASAKTTPRLSFAIDAIAILALVFCRPLVPAMSVRLRSDLAGVLPLAILTAVLSLMALILLSQHPATDGLLARVRGDDITARPALVNVGGGEPGEWREGKIAVTNWSDQPLHVFGGSSGCNFNILQDVPKTIAAGSTQTFRVSYRLADVTGTSNVKVQFWVTQNASPPVAVRFEVGGTTQQEAGG